MRLNKIITNLKNFVLNEFSLLVSEEMWREE